MPAYRLNFMLNNLNSTTLDASIIDAEHALTEVIATLGDAYIGQNFYTSHCGVTQFKIRFTADDDTCANVAANEAVRAAQRIAPVDTVALHRRSRTYVAAGRP